MQVPIKCKTLLGTKGVDFSIVCLQSFIKYSEQKILLEIFEDGTLSDNDKIKILSALPDSIIIDKSIRNSIVENKLSKYPSCLNYRNNTNYAQKLFDVMLYNDEDVLFIDSDVPFIKNFSLPVFTDKPVFMADSHNAYSFTPYEFFKVKHLLLPLINSGLFYFPSKLFNLSLIESLLNDSIIKQGLIRKIPWLEQSIWSILAAKSDEAYYFDYNQIVMAQEVVLNDKIDDKIIAVHCVSSLRDSAYEAICNTVPNKDDPYQIIKLVRIGNYLSRFTYGLEKYLISFRRKTTKNYYKQNIFRYNKPRNKS